MATAVKTKKTAAGKSMKGVVESGYSNKKAKKRAATLGGGSKTLAKGTKKGGKK